MKNNLTFLNCLSLFGKDWRDVIELGKISIRYNHFIVYCKNSHHYIKGIEGLEELREGRKLFKKFLKENINLNK